MENDQLKKAKMWKLIFQAAWFSCFVVGAFGGASYEWWAPEHITNTQVNVVCIIVGLVCFAEAFFKGRFYALSARTLSAAQYADRKMLAKRGTIFVGVLVVLLACGSIGSLLKSGEVRAAAIPGMVFFFVAFGTNHWIWEVFFLKRLGKVSSA